MRPLDLDPGKPSNTAAIANAAATALLSHGDNTWFFITVDYSFGYDLEHNAEAVVEDHGGQVVGGALHPLGASDFVSYLARAQLSGAKVIALANAGADLDNTIKQAAKLGMVPGHQVLAGLLCGSTGWMRSAWRPRRAWYSSESFYWDLNEETRAWSKRFFEQTKKMPNTFAGGGLFRDDALSPGCREGRHRRHQTRS